MVDPKGNRYGIAGAVFIGTVFTIVVIAAMWPMSPAPSPTPVRYEGEVINVICFPESGVVALRIPDGERGFDVYRRECPVLAAHIGDIVSFRVSIGGTVAYDFIVVEDRP